MRTLSSLVLRSTLLMVVAGVGSMACAAPVDDKETGESYDELRALGTAEILGDIAYGDTTLPVAYTNQPAYRAYRFTATAGDDIDIWVGSRDGNARAWLLSSDFRTIAANDDGAANTQDAHITQKIAKAGTYYIAFNEKSGKASNIAVALAKNAFSGLADADYRIEGTATVILKKHAGVITATFGATSGSVTNIALTFDGHFTADNHTGVSSPFGVPNYADQWQTTAGSDYRYQGKVWFDGETLKFDASAEMLAPWTAYHVYQGSLGLGGVLVQQGAANNGVIGDGVHQETVSGFWSSGYPFMSELVFFRTPEGRRFVTESDALKNTGCFRGYGMEITAEGVSQPIDRAHGRLVGTDTFAYSCAATLSSSSESHAIQVKMPAWFN